MPAEVQGTNWLVSYLYIWEPANSSHGQLVTAIFLWKVEPAFTACFWQVRLQTWKGLDTCFSI